MSLSAAPPAELILQPHLGDPREVAAALEQPGVLLRGHFELLSGLHSDAFLRFSVLAANGDRLARVVEALAPSVDATMPSIVLAPSTAGVALGWTLAGRLGLPFAVADVNQLGRAYALGQGIGLDGERVLVVNDVVTTGEGLKALGNVATMAGGTVVGAAWWLSRQDIDISEHLGAPGLSLATLSLTHYEPDGCPGCKMARELVEARDLN